MGALTHSKLDRAVIARYFAFLVISQLIIFTLIGVIFSEDWVLLGFKAVADGYITPDSVREIVDQIGNKASFSEIVDNLHSQCYGPSLFCVHWLSRVSRAAR